MLDFPASPTVGQRFTAAGVTWVWDGAKWVASGSGGLTEAPTDGAAYMRSNSAWSSGGTLKADLVVNGDTDTLTLNGPSNNWAGLLMKSPAGQGNWIGAYVGGKERWEIDLGNGIAESGGNAGSNFQIARFNDAGTLIDDPLIIRRSDGLVTINALSAPQAIGDNRIINGDMRISQRWGGNSGTAAGYTVDRWSYYGSTAGLIQWQQNSNSNAGTTFGYSLNFTSLSAHTIAAADRFISWQSLEADQVTDFQWGTAQAQPVTLSFRARSSKTGSFSGFIQNYAGTRTYCFSFSLPTANAWTFIAINIPGDTAGAWVMGGNGGAIALGFDLGCGTTYRKAAGSWGAGNFCGVTGAQSIVNTNGATFYVTGVKLEIGSVATPFNRQSLAKSVADCQRYYEKSYNAGDRPGTATIVSGEFLYASGAGSGLAGGGMSARFSVAKRAQPTITVYSGLTGSPGAIFDQNSNVDVAATIFEVGDKNFGWYGAPSAGNGINFVIQWTADADF